VVRVEEEVSGRLRQMSRREGVTVFMALLAAFKVVLSRWAGQDDVVIGSSVSGRNRVEAEGLIGFFVNQLVLRTEMSGEATLREVLKRVREVTLGAYQHQDVPFEKLVEELAPGRNLSRRPLFQVKFVFQNAPQERVDLLPGLKLEPFGDADLEAKFGLLLMLSERDNRFTGSISYDPNEFSRSYVELLAAELQEMLTIMVTQCDLPLSSVREKLERFAEQYRENKMNSFKKSFESSLSRRWQAPSLTAPDNTVV
jgi:non-ribosomal peptide synthetase component F